MKASSQQGFGVVTDSIAKKVSLRVLPQNFYTSSLGFICKKEFQLQKLISIPIYFRLGSKEYVDGLERKPNSFVGRRD
ncbi:MAG: hypothetical protein V4676_07990 [Bacteroidota bacterium]